MDDDILREIENDYKMTEEWILNFAERKNEYYENEKNIQDRSYCLGMGRASDPSLLVFKGDRISLSNLDRSEKWLLVIEYALSKLPAKKRIFVEQRRRAEKKNQHLQLKRKGRINWIIFVQEHYATVMAERNGGKPEQYYINESTIKRWWKEIVEKTRVIAMKRNCI